MQIVRQKCYCNAIVVFWVLTSCWCVFPLACISTCGTCSDGMLNSPESCTNGLEQEISGGNGDAVANGANGYVTGVCALLFATWACF